MCLMCCYFVRCDKILLWQVSVNRVTVFFQQLSVRGRLFWQVSVHGGGRSLQLVSVHGGRSLRQGHISGDGRLLQQVSVHGGERTSLRPYLVVSVLSAGVLNVCEVVLLV